MPIVQDFICDPVQEMNWVKGHNAIVGYVNALTIAGTALDVNMTNLWDPISSSNSLQVVGIMDYCGWSGGSTEPIRMSFLVNNANQFTLLNLLSAGLSNTTVSFQFAIYNYDQQLNPITYYATFWSNNVAMNGVVAKEGTVLALNIERVRDLRFVSPFLYRCDLAIAPNPGTAQPLFMANSPTAKYFSVFGTA